MSDFKVKVLGEAAEAVREGSLAGDVYADGDVYVNEDILKAWGEAQQDRKLREEENERAIQRRISADGAKGLR